MITNLNNHETYGEQFDFEYNGMVFKSCSVRPVKSGKNAGKPFFKVGFAPYDMAKQAIDEYNQMVSGTESQEVPKNDLVAKWIARLNDAAPDGLEALKACYGMFLADSEVNALGSTSNAYKAVVAHKDKLKIQVVEAEQHNKAMGFGDSENLPF